MLNKFIGYRTIAINSVAVIVAFASMVGVVIPQDESTAVTAGLLAFLNIIMRLKTTTPVGEKPAA